MFLRATPQEEVQQIVQQTGENAKTALMWFLVIGFIVFLIMFSGSGKRR